MRCGDRSARNEQVVDIAYRHHRAIRYIVAVDPALVGCLARVRAMNIDLVICLGDHIRKRVPLTTSCSVNVYSPSI